MDPRVEKLARVLVHYSVKLKKGQLVKIAGEVAALPLIKAVFAEAVRVGA
ncbi:MAG: aminopeptidase, partial [candidate division Zixibacteria bacterium]|nr:aminopeptidase [candidate division Zixibacteria bacterium]